MKGHLIHNSDKYGTCNNAHNAYKRLKRSKEIKGPAKTPKGTKSKKEN